MATSSITHNFIISTQEEVENFIRALEIAENKRGQPRTPPNGRLLTDPNEISALIRHQAKLLRASNEF